jgi:hypothetical protein
MVAPCPQSDARSPGPFRQFCIDYRMIFPESHRDPSLQRPDGWRRRLRKRRQFSMIWLQTTALPFVSWSAPESEEELISKSGNSRASRMCWLYFVRFDRNALDINPRRGSVTMPERVLGLTEGP